MKTDGLSGFAAWLRLEKITVYHSAATVFRNFVKSLACDETFPDLRVVRLGSEHVTWRDFELFKERFGDRCYFVNALSSSETKTIRQCMLSRDAELDDTLPAGYAVEGVDVLIVDEAGRDLGSETVGEIAVRSRYLTLGYWRQPELTSAVFQNDRADPDLRVFRTGEWGKLCADRCAANISAARTIKLKFAVIALSYMKSSAHC